MKEDSQNTASPEIEHFAKWIEAPQSELRSDVLARDFPDFARVVQELEREREAHSPDAELRARVRKGLFESRGRKDATARRRKAWKKWTGAAAAASFLFAILITIGFSSPTMAEKLKSIPLIKSIFSLFEDQTLQIANDKGLVTPINQSATYNGITVTVNEVFYDGARLDLGYLIRVPQGTSQEEARKISRNIRLLEFTLDDSDKPLPYKGGGEVKQVEDYLFAVVKNVEFNDPLPDKFTLHAKLSMDEDPGNQQGVQKLDIPVVKQIKAEDAVTLTPGTTQTLSSKFSFKVESVALTPVSTTVLLKEIPPDDKPYGPSYTLLNDKGEKIEQVEETSYFDDNGLWRKFVIPFKERPPFIKLIPSMDGVEEPDKAVTIPLKK